MKLSQPFLRPFNYTQASPNSSQTHATEECSLRVYEGRFASRTYMF